MSDAAIIRTVLPKHGPKRLARLMGVKLGTAHEWVYRRISATRRRELALALLAELDRQDTERADVRDRLLEMAGETGALAIEVDRARVGKVDRSGGAVAATPIARKLAKWSAE